MKAIVIPHSSTAAARMVHRNIAWTRRVNTARAARLAKRRSR